MLRLVDGDCEEVRAELRLGEAVRHPGLVTFTGMGPLRGGGCFLVREWVPGEPLSDWARGRDGRSVGRVIAHLAEALQALHDGGFVHADVKAENVVVTGEGMPVLIDYGLGRPLGESGGGGSWYAAAPEQLRGEPLDLRTDVFALGAMLHGLLVPERAAPEAFHGSFPADDFFTASRSRAEDLPAWARDLVHRMVRRSIGDRPASCRAVADDLVRRLGVEIASGWRAERRPPRLQPWAGEGRRAFLEGRLSDSLVPGVEAWVAPAGEELDALAQAAAKQALMDGAPLACLQLLVDTEQLAGSTDLARWATEFAESHTHVPILVSLGQGEFEREALRWLVRARARSGPGRTIVLTHSPPAPWSEEHSIYVVPPLVEGDIEGFFGPWLAADDNRLLDLIARFEAESGGAASRFQELFDEWVGVGMVRWSQGWSLRPGDLLSHVRPSHQGRAASDQDLEIELALTWLRGVEIHELARVVEGPDVAERTARLVGRGRIRSSPGGRLLPGYARPVGGGPWRDLHGRIAVVLQERGSPIEAAMHRFAAAGQGGDLDAVLQHAQAATMTETPHRVVDLLTRLRELCRECARPFLADCLEALGMAQAEAGEFDAARETARGLTARESSRAKGQAARIRGRIALRLGNLEEALGELRTASKLGRDPDGGAVLAEAMTLASAADWEALGALRAQAARPEDSRAAATLEINLVSLANPGLLEAGDFEGARRALVAVQRLADQVGEARATAPLELNLALVARAQGRMDLAKAHLEQARALHSEAGSLAGIAQAEAAMGNLLRENGSLSEGQAWLEQALEKRALLGEEEGVLLVRGGLAVLRAERGHVAAALHELTAVLDEMNEGSRPQEQEWMRLHRVLLQAATEGPMPLGPWPSGDRARLLWIRCGWMQGDLEGEDLRARLAGIEGERCEEEAAWLRSILGGSEGRLPKLGCARLRASVYQGLRSPLLGEEAWSLAEELEGRGVDGLLARLYFGLAQRGPADQQGEAVARGRRMLLRCSEGLTSEQRERLLPRLLGVPDPVPQECRFEEEMDVDVIEILEINRLLVEHDDLGTLLKAIVRCAVNASGAERGFLALEVDGALSLDHALDSSYGEIELPEVEVSYTVLGKALSEGRPLRWSESLETGEIDMAASVESLALRSILATPFRVEPGLRGVLYLDHRSKVGAFDERAERLIQLLSDQASLAIRQVQRFEEIQALKAELEVEVVDQGTRLEAARRELEAQGGRIPIRGLVGDSEPMRRVQHLLRQVAPSDLSVLVLGASGTGKELAARAVHELSGRSEGPFVAENCAAIPEGLLEAELFGASKGAYTGAGQSRDGLFGRADGGTLFLDEIGELPAGLQAKLLRVLETKRVRRIGEDQDRSVDFRLVTATHQDLDSQVAEGTFRADLFFRLDGMRIVMPNLEERLDDLSLLIDHFLRLDERRSGVRRFCSPEVLRALGERAWPGNVRELANEVARLCILSDGDLRDPSLVRPAYTGLAAADSRVVRPLAELEREAIERALEQTGNDKGQAAKLLGISRAKIYQRLKEWRE